MIKTLRFSFHRFRKLQTSSLETFLSHISPRVIVLQKKSEDFFTNISVIKPGLTDPLQPRKILVAMGAQTCNSILQMKANVGYIEREIFKDQGLICSPHQSCVSNSGLFILPELCRNSGVITLPELCLEL